MPLRAPPPRTMLPLSLPPLLDTDLVQRVLAAGLRGRGGGWFPAGRKWLAVRAEGGEPFVVANGAEGEPGSIKDRFVMLTRPDQVVEGLALAARAVGAKDAVLYLKGSFAGPAQALSGALARAGIEEPRIAIRRGEEGYIAGEETAILETLEGRRAWPRPKPPLPACVGFEGRPTLVQNVETLSRVPSAISDPKAFPTEESTLLSLWGHVRRPGVYEVRLGTPLARVIEECGEGAPDGVGLLFPGGPSASPLLPEEARLPLDPDVLREAGSGLGTASFLVLGRGVCPIAAGVSLATFFERESCAQCPPCSVGTANLARLVRGIETGTSRAGDLQALGETAGFMSAHGYCAHGRTGAASVTGLVSRFRKDVDEHVAARGCPRGGPLSDPFGDDSPEQRAIEAALLHATLRPNLP
jgi:NADH-quinone oxidoreductase subunit F